MNLSIYPREGVTAGLYCIYPLNMVLKIRILQAEAPATFVPLKKDYIRRGGTLFSTDGDVRRRITDTTVYIRDNHSPISSTELAKKVKASLGHPTRRCIIKDWKQ